MEQHTCAQCDAPIKRTKPCGPLPKYCRSECRRAAAKARDVETGRCAKLLAKQRAAYTPTTHSITCACCATAFIAKRKDTKYCSPQCMEQGNIRRCEEVGCGKPHRAKGLCSSHYNAKHLPGSQKRWPASQTTRRVALRKKTQRRRALTKLPTADLVDRDLIGARDGWRCGVCRKIVNKALPWPDPMSPSLDHVVPLSQGGEHTCANTRITHLTCNLARSNRGGGEQLALI